MARPPRFRKPRRSRQRAWGGEAWPELGGSQGSSGHARSITVRPSRPPFGAGMIIQAVVPHIGDRPPVVPLRPVARNQVFVKNLVSQAADGKSGRIFRRPVEQLLVEYYQREQHDQRLERQPEQRQREQHQQDEQQLRVAGAWRRMMASPPLATGPHPQPLPRNSGEGSRIPVPPSPRFLGEGG